MQRFNSILPSLSGQLLAIESHFHSWRWMVKYSSHNRNVVLFEVLLLLNDPPNSNLQLLTTKFSSKLQLRQLKLSASTRYNTPSSLPHSFGRRLYNQSLLTASASLFYIFLWTNPESIHGAKAKTQTLTQQERWIAINVWTKQLLCLMFQTMSNIAFSLPIHFL